MKNAKHILGCVNIAVIIILKISNSLINKSHRVEREKRDKIQNEKHQIIEKLDPYFEEFTRCIFMGKNQFCSCAELELDESTQSHVLNSLIISNLRRTFSDRDQIIINKVGIGTEFIFLGAYPFILRFKKYPIRV